MKKINILVVLTLLILQASFAQESPTTNFYSLLDSLYQNDSNLSLPDSLKSGATKDIDRMKLMWSPALSPHGDASIGANAIINYSNQFNSGPPGTSDIEGNWRPEGPIGSNNFEHTGQIHRITFDSKYDGVSNKTIYAGSFFGGLWKSDDDGMSWGVLNTDSQLPQTSVSGIAVGYQNNQNLFICTGQGDNPYYVKTNLGGGAHPIYTNGIYRSKNGGEEWEAINQGFLNNFLTGGTCRNIIIDPNNDNILYVATTNGVYKTTNSLASSPTWVKLPIPVIGGVEDFNGLKMHPTNSNVIYASSNEIYKSTDGGYLVAGAFDHYQGHAKNALVKLDSNGIVEPQYFTSAGPDSSAQLGAGFPAIGVKESKFGGYYVFGDFTKWDGQPTQPILRLRDLVTGIEPSSLKLRSLKLYPNPSKGTVNISNAENIQAIRIYNLQGQLVKSLKPNGYQFELPEQTGMYIIQIEDEEGNVISKKSVRN